MQFDAIKFAIGGKADTSFKSFRKSGPIRSARLVQGAFDQVADDGLAGLVAQREGRLQVLYYLGAMLRCVAHVCPFQ
jgi:hypothetical protein